MTSSMVFKYSSCKATILWKLAFPVIFRGSAEEKSRVSPFREKSESRVSSPRSICSEEMARVLRNPFRKAVAG